MTVVEDGALQRYQPVAPRLRPLLGFDRAYRMEGFLDVFPGGVFVDLD